MICPSLNLSFLRVVQIICLSWNLSVGRGDLNDLAKFEPFLKGRESNYLAKFQPFFGKGVFKLFGQV